MDWPLWEKKILELTAKFPGKTTANKLGAMVAGSTKEQLDGLLLEGFAGFVHQTAFLARVRTPADIIGIFADAPRNGDIDLLLRISQVDANPVRGRFLVFIKRRMEFVGSQDAGFLSFDIPFPVAIHVTGNILIVQVMTMQSGISTWGRIIGQRFRKKLTVVRADYFHEKTMGFIVAAGGESPKYIDCSRRAVELMKSNRVDTFGGRYSAGLDGDTTYRTIRGKGKRALRESRLKDFNSLIGATHILNAELVFKAAHADLEAGSKVALYPNVGKVSFRSNLEGCDPDEFLKKLATT